MSGEAAHVRGRPLAGRLPRYRPFPASDVTSGEAFVAMGRLFDQARCRPTFLKQPAIPELVLQSIKHGADIGHYHMHAWVIVPNHVHLLLTARVSLLKLLGSLKAAGSNSKTTL